MVKLDFGETLDCADEAETDYAGMRYADWIREKIDSNPRLKRIGLARALGVDPSTITNILNGRRRIYAHEISIITDYIGEPWPFNDLSQELTRESVAPTKIPIRGEVAAGVWLEVELLNAAVEEEFAAFIPADIAGAAGVFGMRVKGESVNRIAPAGAILICTPDKTALDDLADGMLIVVHQRQANSGLTEISCRRVCRKDDAIELAAESHDRAFARPMRLSPHAAEGRTVEIMGRVRYVIIPV